MSSPTSSLTQGWDLLYLWIYIMSCLQMLKKVPLSPCRAGFQSFPETHAYIASSSWTEKVCHKTSAQKHLQLHHITDTKKKKKKSLKTKGCVCWGPGCTHRLQLPWPAPPTVTPSSVTNTLQYLPLHKGKILLSPVSEKPSLYHWPSQKNQTMRTTFLIRKIFSFCPSSCVIIGRSLTSG